MILYYSLTCTPKKNYIDHMVTTLWLCSQFAGFKRSRQEYPTNIFRKIDYTMS